MAQSFLKMSESSNQQKPKKPGGPFRIPNKDHYDPEFLTLSPPPVDEEIPRVPIPVHSPSHLSIDNDCPINVQTMNTKRNLTVQEYRQLVERHKRHVLRKKKGVSKKEEKIKPDNMSQPDSKIPSSKGAFSVKTDHATATLSNPSQQVSDTESRRQRRRGHNAPSKVPLNSSDMNDVKQVSSKQGQATKQVPLSSKVANEVSQTQTQEQVAPGLDSSSAIATAAQLDENNYQVSNKQDEKVKQDCFEPDPNKTGFSKDFLSMSVKKKEQEELKSKGPLTKITQDKKMFQKDLPEEIHGSIHPHDLKLVQKSMWLSVKLNRAQKIVRGQEVEKTASEEWTAFVEKAVDITTRLNSTCDSNELAESFKVKIKDKAVSDLTAEEDKIRDALSKFSLTDCDITELVGNLEKARNNLEDALNNYLQQINRDQKKEEQLCTNKDSSSSIEPLGISDDDEDASVSASYYDYMCRSLNR